MGEIPGWATYLKGEGCTLAAGLNTWICIPAADVPTKLLSMYSPDLFNSWYEKELKNYIQTDISDPRTRKYKKKGYLHFDQRFWFPEHFQEVQNLLQNGLRKQNTKTGKEEWYSFFPFLKLVSKTPKFKVQRSNEPEIKGKKEEIRKVKKRPISYASHFDSLIFGYFSHALEEKYEQNLVDAEISEAVLAYRKNDGKCNIQYSKEVFDFIRTRGECCAIALDIKGYFDNIDHGILREMWERLMGAPLSAPHQKVYNAITSYAYVNYLSLERTLNQHLRPKRSNEKAPKSILDLLPRTKTHEKFRFLKERNLIQKNEVLSADQRPIGIPQGSPMSAVLSNMYLFDFDQYWTNKSRTESFLYRRYCDDIIVVCQIEEAGILAEEIREMIKGPNFRLTIQPAKVESIDFLRGEDGSYKSFKREDYKSPASPLLINSKPLQYLGFEFDGKDVRIRSSSLARYYKKFKARLKKTVRVAYGNTPKMRRRTDQPMLRHTVLQEKIALRQILLRYTFVGHRNFISYALKASKAEYENSEKKIMSGHGSNAIRKQVAGHLEILRKTLARYITERYKQKLSSKRRKSTRRFQFSV